MFARDRIGDKNWDTYEEYKKVEKCKCGKGFIEHVTLVASHEKVLKIERDSLGYRLNCPNKDCPSKNKI